jgi:hypothetical protein
VQPFTSFHLNSDVYFRARAEPNGATKPPFYWLGPTVGILPWEKLHAEVGFDLWFQGVADLDTYPVYFHGKVGSPEDTVFRWWPAIAAGVYNLGVKSGLNTMDIVYGIVGHSVPYGGRFQLGYYWSPFGGSTTPNNLAFVDENGVLRVSEIASEFPCNAGWSSRVDAQRINPGEGLSSR